MRASALTGSGMSAVGRGSTTAVLLALTIVAFVGDVPVVAASCAAPAGGIPDADTAFVGTVVEQHERHARVDVDEVWRGPDLAPTVWVATAAHGNPWPLSLFVSSSLDAHLVSGRRYIIAGEGGELRTDACLVAQASDPLVERLAPETTREPVAGGTTGEKPLSSKPTVIAGIGLTLVALASAGSWLAYQRKRSRHA